jgi:stress-induced morphogen
MITDDIRSAIEAQLPGAVVSVRNPAGGHFEIDVRSAAFAGKTPLQQQRMVYSAIAHLMKGDGAPVHAIDKLTTVPA